VSLLYFEVEDQILVPVAADTLKVEKKNQLLVYIIFNNF
jgi:hypothetical protein